MCVEIVERVEALAGMGGFRCVEMGGDVFKCVVMGGD